MVEQIVTLTPSEIATRIEEETSNLRVCRTLMLDALQFRYMEAEEAGLAQEQLYFLVNTLGDLQKRLAALQGAAYAAAYAQKAPA